MLGRTLTRAISLATVLSLLLASTAFADTLVADSDALTHGNQTNVFLHSDDGMTQEFNVALAIECASKNDHIDGNTTVSMDTAASSVPTGGSLSAASATIVRPGTWPLDGTDCPDPAPVTGAVNSKVTVTAPAATTADKEYTFQLRWTASDADVKQVSGANVAIHFTVKGTGNSGGGGTTNTAPTVDAGGNPTDGAYSGIEGAGISLAGSASDTDGPAPLTLAWTATPVSGNTNAACLFADASAATTTITCNDNGTWTLRLTATDGAGASNYDEATLTVANAIPVPNAGADQTVNEGTLVNLSGGFTDAGSNDTHTEAWSVSAPNGQVIAGGSSSTFSFRPGDNGTYTVTYTVTDDDSGQAFDTAVITVLNVAPTTSNASVVNSGLTATGYTFTASFDYSDAGWLDTHPNSSISWTVNGQPYAASSTVTPAGDTGTPPFETGSVRSSITLGPGCYTIAASGSAVDDDGGTTPVALSTGYESTQLDIPTLAFLAPIKDNERNIAKYGNVVPVKVAATSSCSPGMPYAIDLYVTWVIGSGGEVTDDTPVVIAESVSNADSGAKMRLADGFQIYNLTTKAMTAGKDHTVQIRHGSTTGTILLKAVLQPKK